MTKLNQKYILIKTLGVIMQTNLQELEKSLENILLQDIQKIIFSQSTKQSKYKKNHY